MGIRFLCQNCEKRLNVKSVQAGKYGQCPACQSKILVPKESTLTLASANQQPLPGSSDGSSALDESSIGLQPGDDQITSEGIPAEDLQQRVGVETDAPSFHDSAVAAVLDDQSSELFMLDKPELPESLGKVDPITQAPNQIWYFRSRELGERGPLKPKAMRKYVDQGDVTVGCIVWRQDWNDWLPAERVFPRLADQAAGRTPENDDRQDLATTRPNEAPVAPPTPLELRQRRTQRIFLISVLIGILICCLLLAVVLRLIANDL